MTRKGVLVHIEDDILYHEGQIYERLTPESMDDFLSQLIVNARDTYIVWIMDGKLYQRDFIKMMYHIGFKDVTFQNPSVKSMGNKNFKYAIGDNGILYFLIVKSNKKTIYFYNSDNLLASLPAPEIIKAWGSPDTPDKLAELARATYKGVEALHGYQSKRTPYTISMVASRAWREIEGLYQCPELVDMRGQIAPDGKSLDDYIRRSYVGGWNFLQVRDPSEYRHKGGVVYDVNSLYPFISSTKPLPWGAPIPFTGKPEGEAVDDRHYYYIRVRIQFDLKEGSFPYIQKRGDFRYRLMDYLKTSDVITYTREGQERRTKKIIDTDGKVSEVFPEFVFSKTDWELIQRHYDIHKVEYIDGVYFRVCRCVFGDFVKHYYGLKKDARDPGSRRVAKMILNGVIGTLAKRGERTDIIYYEDEDGVLRQGTFRMGNPAPSYIHIASAILSYAREYIYEAACKNFSRFLYTDTDSLHLIGTEPADLPVSDKIGDFKIEHTFKDCFYFKRKSYILLQSDDKYDLTLAGVADDYKRFIEDILDGMDADEIERRAKQNHYGYMRHIFDISDRITGTIWYQGKDYPVIKEDYGRQHDLFMAFIKDIQGLTDKMTALQYVAYPTGRREVEDYHISEEICWLTQKQRAKFKI